MKPEQIDPEQYWKIRAERYNQLSWVSNRSYLDAFIEAGKFNKSDSVLDVGTGTGAIAHALAPLVKEVIGMDISQEMLSNCDWSGNKFFIRRDIKKKIFCDSVFDKVTARMVFHHITVNLQEAMDECYRLLKNGGLMVLSEGVPPVPELKEDYKKIFQLKEDRLVFLEEDLHEMMRVSEFRNIQVIPHIMNNFSVRNWLENSGLPEEKQNMIFEMHVTGSPEFKKAYNMKIINGDCLINVKKVILVGEK